MKNKFRNLLSYKVSKILLLSLVFSLAYLGVLVTIVGDASNINIDIESAYYEVNEQGDLTVQILGTMKDVSVSECDFRLSIPESFEIPMQVDGSPVLELSNDGLPSTKNLNNDRFQIDFAVITHNSTGLPFNYTLEVHSNNFLYTRTIVPEWPHQTPLAGGGASISQYFPYITSFHAYDSFKGNKPHVKTYLYNPSSLPQLLFSMKYKIDSNNYYWEDWTQQHLSPALILPYQSWVIHNYLSRIFTGSDGIYALNTGTYTVTEVYAIGVGWTDSYNPTPSDRNEFDISVASGTHPVFVLHLRDSDHVSEFGSGNFLRSVETHQFEYNGQDTSTKEHFNIDFFSKELSWSPNQYDLDYLFNTQLKADAGDLLGLSGDWTKRSGTKGTHEDNHGFDAVIGSSGKQNSVDDGEGFYSCRAQPHGNYMVTMDGWKWWIFYTDYSQSEMERATLHEIFHTYDADHVTNGYIMTAFVTMQGWELHSDTNTAVNNDIDHYDGPP